MTSVENFVSSTRPVPARTHHKTHASEQSYFKARVLLTKVRAHDMVVLPSSTWSERLLSTPHRHCHKDHPKSLKSSAVAGYDSIRGTASELLQPRPKKGDWDQRRFRGLTTQDRKSTRLNSSHVRISYAVFCLKKKKTHLARPAC